MTTHATMDFSRLIPTERIDRMVQYWFDDDDNISSSSFDINRMIIGTDTRKATLCLKSSGIVAGKPFVDAIFHKLNCKVVWNKDIQEGIYINVSNTNHIPIATISGPTHQLLKGERIALNILSRCSGIATETYNIIHIAKNEYNWNGYITGGGGTTMTTIPGFRLVEQYGLLIGGALTHHHDRNHIIILQSNLHLYNKMNNSNNLNENIQHAVTCAKRISRFSQKLEVECISYEQGIVAAAAGADIVMLNQYPTTAASLTHDAIKIKQQYPNIQIEVCCNSNNNIIHYLSEYVDIISLGKLTQGYACLDYALNISNPSAVLRKERQPPPAQQQEEEVTNDESDNDDKSISPRSKRRLLCELSTTSSNNDDDHHDHNDVEEKHLLLSLPKKHKFSRTRGLCTIVESKSNYPAFKCVDCIKKIRTYCKCSPGIIRCQSCFTKHYAFHCND